MQPGPSLPRDDHPVPEVESLAMTRGRSRTTSEPGTKPFTGGYYWFPTPTTDGVTWSIVTCRDLGCGRDAGHDAELWPRLMAPLAAAWGQDGKVLRRKLALSYTGLPRGRVTRPEKSFLILHGDDSPVPAWQGPVIRAFRLGNRRVKLLFDEHETMIPGHPQAVASSLGIRLHGTRA